MKSWCLVNSAHFASYCLAVSTQADNERTGLKPLVCPCVAHTAPKPAPVSYSRDGSSLPLIMDKQTSAASPMCITSLFNYILMESSAGVRITERARCCQCHALFGILGWCRYWAGFHFTNNLVFGLRFRASVNCTCSSNTRGILIFFHFCGAEMSDANKRGWEVES